MEESNISEIQQRASSLAKKLLAQAKFNEAKITKDLQNITEKLEVELNGLENKFKTEHSLVRKLIDSSVRDLSDLSLEAKLEKHSKRVNDVLRYTFLLPIDSYKIIFERILKTLSNSGYEINERRIWNAWENAETERDTGYRGINITVKSSNKQLFELQFHTEESFRLKSETHNLYEEARQISISERRRNEIIEQIIKLAIEVEIPKEYRK